ncbi:MAG: hypothetical protein IPO09_02810 [Anaeromyxobacter sp.]|nr:hypothetical protein [Anaeromyxobacter sp.]MBL0275513.1 hypothetical protein [Anaeromyxobacter sp.]
MLLAAALALAACAPPGAGRTPPQAPDPAAVALAEGDAAWPGRAEPAQLAAGLAAYRRAAAARPADATLELRLARAEGFRALAAAAPAEAREAHEASSRAAERALALAAPAFAEALRSGTAPAEAVGLIGPAGAEPLYWLALGRMGVAQATGHAAVLAVKDHALALMARAAALDEQVERGGPLRALGAWQAMLPVAAGGGAAGARAHFERAAARFGDEPWRRVAEAATLTVLLQDGAAFDRLLAEVLAGVPQADPDRAPELLLAQRRARALLDKRASLF